MTNDERAKKLRIDAPGIAPQENMDDSQKPTQNKQKLSLQFKGGKAHLVLSTDDKG